VALAGPADDPLLVLSTLVDATSRLVVHRPRRLAGGGGGAAGRRHGRLLGRRLQPAVRPDALDH
jgi:hypothetical protein